MGPIVSEEHSCEDNELENTVVYHACAVTLSMKKPLEPSSTIFVPADVFPDKGTMCSTIKGEMQRFSVFDCIASLLKMVPYKQ
jgi:hypothetical protein